MPAKDLGTKHNCFKCGTRFYDLKKPEAVCPKCGADMKDSPALKAPPPQERRTRARPAVDAVEEPLVDEADMSDELDDDVADDDADEAVDDEG